MNSICNLFKFNSSKNQKRYIKRHKVRNIDKTKSMDKIEDINRTKSIDKMKNIDEVKNFDEEKDIVSASFHSSDSKDEHLIIYNELVYQLYCLKMKEPDNIEKISWLELEIMSYVNKYNIANAEKINASLLAIEKYYDKLKEKELEKSKRRGITIYEDLYYKLYKLKIEKSDSKEKQAKLENKIVDCANKYNLENIEKIDAQMRAIIRYNELSSRKEENKNKGLSIYKDLVVELYNLKQKESKNREKINQIELKMKKCESQYKLNNIDKLDIQLEVLEVNN